MTKPNPTHLFISYALEDLPCATWLARKLAAQGYPVWFDKLKSLGGEPWPQSLDETIKDRTFRVLALVSEHSTRKKKPNKEHMLAQRVVRQQGISDFLIPLALDDSELDPLIATAPEISFEDGWGAGWKGLLELLDSIGARRTLKTGAQLAAASFPQGEDLVNDAAGRIFANLVRIKTFPKTLRIFQPGNTLALEGREKLEEAWTFYDTPGGAIVALIPPPPEFDGTIRSTRKQLIWEEPGSFHLQPLRDIAAALILKALGRRLLKAGCRRDPNSKFKDTYFLPENYSNDGHLAFTGFEGKQMSIPIRNKVAFRRVAGVTEVNFHHFAFRLRLARGFDQGFCVQLKPTLVFFDEDGHPISDVSAIARVRRVIKTWRNEEWLNRTMAIEAVLNGSLPAGVNDPVLEPGLVMLDSPLGLDEGVLEAGKDKTDEQIFEQEFELEEPEVEEANE